MWRERIPRVYRSRLRNVAGQEKMTKNEIKLGPKAIVEFISRDEGK
jgi:hypothetical protein